MASSDKKFDIDLGESMVSREKRAEEFQVETAGAFLAAIEAEAEEALDEMSWRMSAVLYGAKDWSELTEDERDAYREQLRLDGEKAKCRPGYHFCPMNQYDQDMVEGLEERGWKVTSANAYWIFFAGTVFDDNTRDPIRCHSGWTVTPAGGEDETPYLELGVQFDGS